MTDRVVAAAMDPCILRHSVDGTFTIRYVETPVDACCPPDASTVSALEVRQFPHRFGTGPVDRKP